MLGSRSREHSQKTHTANIRLAEGRESLPSACARMRARTYVLPRRVAVKDDDRDHVHAFSCACTGLGARVGRRQSRLRHNLAPTSIRLSVSRSPQTRRNAVRTCTSTPITARRVAWKRGCSGRPRGQCSPEARSSRNCSPAIGPAHPSVESHKRVARMRAPFASPSPPHLLFEHELGFFTARSP